MQVRRVLRFLAELKGVTAQARRTGASTSGSTGSSSRHREKDWGLAKVDELSRGMQQKVQFIGTLLHDPDLVILDEPFSGLDPINAQALKDTIVELKTRGKTVIFSTHLMDNAERMCDSVCIIARGRKVLDGGVAEVRKAHSGRKVALAVAGDARQAVAPVLADRTLVSRVDDQNRYFEIELARARTRRSCCGARGSRRVDQALRAGAAVAAPDLPRERRRHGRRGGDDGSWLSSGWWSGASISSASARSGSCIGTLLGPVFFLLIIVAPRASAAGGASTSDVAHIRDPRRHAARAWAARVGAALHESYPCRRPPHGRRRHRSRRCRSPRTARRSGCSVTEVLGYLVLDARTVAGTSVRYAGRNASSYQRHRRHPRRRAPARCSPSGWSAKASTRRGCAAFTEIRARRCTRSEDRRQGAREGQRGSASDVLRLRRRAPALHDDRALRPDDHARRAGGEDDARRRGRGVEREHRHPARRQDPRRGAAWRSRRSCRGWRCSRRDDASTACTSCSGDRAARRRRSWRERGRKPDAGLAAASRRFRCGRRSPCSPSSCSASSSTRRCSRRWARW